MAYEAKVLLDSVGPNGARLTTFEVTIPRIVLAEFNTHRVIGRNSASSRAIPVEKRCDMIDADPFIPTAFTRNRKGMQADDVLTGASADEALQIWERARFAALHHAREMAREGVHKQLANRLTEPFAWHTIVATATEWSNYWHRRVHKDAQPEIEIPSRMMKEALDASEPYVLDAGEWHLPLVTDCDSLLLRDAGYDEAALCRISVARCARVSYLTHEGKRDPREDLALYDRLVAGGHLSPTEHVAQAMTAEQWRDYGWSLAQRWVEERVPVGNLWGWKQYRKTIAHEHDAPAT